MKSIIFTLLAVLASPALAVNAWHHSTISHVVSYPNGDFSIIFHQDSNCINYGSSKQHLVRVNENGMTQEGANKIHATALSAAATQQNVGIYFDKDTHNCYINMMSITYNPAN